MAEKKEAPSTAATVQSAKIINFQPEDTTKTKKRQAGGEIIQLAEYQPECPPGVKWLYDGLSKTPLGQTIIKTLILAAETEVHHYIPHRGKPESR